MVGVLIRIMTAVSHCKNLTSYSLLSDAHSSVSLLVCFHCQCDWICTGISFGLWVRDSRIQDLGNIHVSRARWINYGLNDVLLTFTASHSFDSLSGNKMLSDY